MKTNFLTIVLLLTLYPLIGFSQENMITVPIINEPVSDFQLNDQNGNPVSLSSYKGKNVMLIFPRGMVKKDYWCQICHYQYADLADVVKKENILKKYDLEVLFILPYQSDSISNWINMFPVQMEIIDNWKFPKDTLNMNESKIKWANTTRKLLPKKIFYTADNIDTPFPILSDGQRAVSKGFQLYKNEPGAPQNMPAIMIIDKDGILRYKYLSQDTKDRPTYDYLFKIMDVIL